MHIINELLSFAARRPNEKKW